MSKSYVLKNTRVLVLGGAALIAWMYVVAHLRVSWSDSLNSRVFWLVEPKEITRNDIVDFVVRDQFTKYLPHEMIKRVGCDSGDLLTVKNRHYYCNGKLLGKAKTHSLDGIPVGHYGVSGVIPNGYLFAIGDTADSYDSRYYGLVKKPEIKAKVIALF